MGEFKAFCLPIVKTPFFGFSEDKLDFAPFFLQSEWRQDGLTTRGFNFLVFLSVRD
jgi:hypothetical protein